MAPEQKKQGKPIAIEGLQLERIPQPPTVPIVGNLTSLDLDDPSRSVAQLASRYGPIYRFSVPGLNMIVISSWKLVNEACDDSRFKKSLQGELEVCRHSNPYRYTMGVGIDGSVHRNCGVWFTMAFSR